MLHTVIRSDQLVDEHGMISVPHLADLLTGVGRVYGVVGATPFAIGDLAIETPEPSRDCFSPTTLPLSASIRTLLAIVGMRPLPEDVGMMVPA